MWTVEEAAQVLGISRTHAYEPWLEGSSRLSGSAGGSSCPRPIDTLLAQPPAAS